LVQRVILFKPRAVAVVGITAFRDAFMLPKATLGPQNTSSIKEWPQGVLLWVLPHPSGLNAHENIESLAQTVTAACEASRADYPSLMYVAMFYHSALGIDQRILTFMEFNWFSYSLGTEAILLLASFVLSGIIGVEREIQHKSAGARTHI